MFTDKGELSKTIKVHLTNLQRSASI
jgi:hypothetical protein